MKTARVLIVGDVYCSSKTKLSLSPELKSFVDQHDSISVNLEGPLAKSSSIERNKVGPQLRQHESVLALLDQISCTIVNLANNHIFDFGIDAFVYTKKKLSHLAMIGAGENYSEAHKLHIETIHGVKVGYLSYGEAEFGVIKSDVVKNCGFAWVCDPSVPSKILAAKNKVDVLIVQVHAGIEDIDLPLPEWRSVYKSLIDFGADVIVGHHPHVVQTVELYKERPIYYSIGNFYFDTQLNSRSNSIGAAVSLKCSKNGLVSHERKLTYSEKNKVFFCPDNLTEKSIVNSRISNEKDYLHRINAIALDHLNKHYLAYFWLGLVGIRHSNRFIFALLVFIKQLIKNKYHDSLFLLHNMRIESHRWMIERALTLEQQKT